MVLSFSISISSNLYQGKYLFEICEVEIEYVHVYT